MKAHRVVPVLLALLPLACGFDLSNLGGPTLDAYSSNIRLGGFPASQLVEDPISGQRGRLQVGQRIPLELRGETDRIQSVTWVVDYPPEPPHPPVVRLTGTGRLTAILEGVEPGGDHIRDYAFAFANVVFKDGSEQTASPAACPNPRTWTPARCFVVAP
jgi:hypothetical protein